VIKKSFLKDQCGATAIEYALVAMFIGLAIISAGSTVGTELANVFNGISGFLQ